MSIVEMGAAIPWKVQTWKGGKATDLDDHELYETLLEHPNVDQSWEEFIGEQLGFLCINGEALTYQKEYLSGRHQWFSLAPPHWALKPGEDRFTPIQYWFPVGKENEAKFRIPAEEILHAKLFNPHRGDASDRRGMSPIRAGLLALQEDNSAVRSSIRAFQNQGPGGIISKEKGLPQETAFSTDQFEQLRDTLDRNYTGEDHARKTLVTTGVVKFQQVGLSPVDLNILAQRPYTRGELCNLYHFPVNLLNDNSASTYNNLIEMEKAAYKHAILPKLYRIRGAINKGIQKKYNDKNIWVTPDLSAVEALQQNVKDQVEALKGAWWIKGIDKQRMMGLEEDSALDYYADDKGQPLPTPEEASEARLGAIRLPGEQEQAEEEEQTGIRIAKELQLDYFAKNGTKL
jgi:HK97 family phage portal protein